MITPYVTIDGCPKFERNKTGFGYMVMDIAKAVGEIEEVDVLATDTLGEEFEVEGINFQKRSMLGYLRALFSCLPICVLIHLWKKYKMSLGVFVRTTYYWLMTGYLRNLIRKNRYDVIHIHGCSFATELWMQVCGCLGQRYLVTLHGLNSFSDTVHMEATGKQYERDFLQRVTKGEIPITVISTGMKSIIEKKYGVNDCKNIKVVCNSFSFGPRLDNDNSMCLAAKIRELYNIPVDARILLYVGNISLNKNQQQMVEAYSMLPEHVRNQTWVLFCGRPSQNGSFERAVKENPYKNHLVLCGIVEKNSIADYYKEASGVVLLSIAEGFGLSLIEGMHFGVPCAMFKDMDAFEDIYDSCAVVPIENRDGISVASAIEQLLEREWNNTEIEAYSKKFDSVTMAQNYISAYTKL